MRAGPLANRVACTRALLPAGVSLCVSASASAFASSLWQLWHPHTAMQAHGSLVCEQAARKLAAREWYGGGSGAARRLRGSGATRRRGSGAGAAQLRRVHVPAGVKGGLVGLGLHSVCGAAGEAWHDAAGAVMHYQIASREALRAGQVAAAARNVTAVRVFALAVCLVAVWLRVLHFGVCGGVRRVGSGC